MQKHRFPVKLHPNIYYGVSVMESMTENSVEQQTEQQKEFEWDKDFFEKKLNLFSNCQFGFIGAALMLMMMDLSKPYLLAPLAVGLFMTSWLKHHYGKVAKPLKKASIQLAPKSLLISKPADDSEQRITFREIEELDLRKDNFIPVLFIYLKDGSQVELEGFQNADELYKQLSSALQNPTSSD